MFLPQRHEGQLAARQLLGLLPGLASAMKYLSEMGYVHRGLAARRVLLSSGLICKISGFGRGPRDRAEAVYTTMVRVPFSQANLPIRPHQGPPHPLLPSSLPCQGHTPYSPAPPPPRPQMNAGVGIIMCLPQRCSWEDGRWGWVWGSVGWGALGVLGPVPSCP